MDEDEVVITGLGAICCLGAGVPAFWAGLTSATSSPTPIPDQYCHVDNSLVYQVPADDDPGRYDLAGAPLGRAARYATLAAREAVTDAGLTLGDGQLGDGQPGVDPDRLAVVIGTGMGDTQLREIWRAGSHRAGSHSAGHRADSHSAGQHAIVFTPASAVAAELGAGGPVGSVSTACAAGGYALSYAADLIRSGAASVAVAGGTDTYSRIALGCFNRMGAVDPERCRPFDRNRQGTVFGEGAAMLVLESAAHARRRGARRYARLAGSGWSCDAHHLTAPEPAGSEIIRAMLRAIADGGITAADVGAVVPHGTGTQLNDVVEGIALNGVLGDASRVPLYNLKALIGHTGGAAGAFAALAGALILHRGTVPRNAAPKELDPACELWIPTETEARPTGTALLVNAYAFGGNNVSLALTEAT